jgi:hypothetical protein
LVMNTILGATCGPLLVAGMTSLLGDPAKVGWSIAMVAGPSVVLGAALFAIARRAARRAATRKA